MRCAGCGTQVVEKRGEIDLRINNKLFLARNVCNEECSSCGEKVLSPADSQALYEKIRHGEFVEETFRIPVLEGTC